MAKKLDMNAMNVDQLQQMIAADRMKLTRMEFNHAVSPLENPMDLRFTRRNIARAMTALTQKQNVQ
jgi:large subunit ribosomal protein L29